MQVLNKNLSAVRSPAKESRFQHSIENLRGLAILFVVLSHVTSVAALGLGGEIVSFIFQDATAWFVFISGYLFHRVEQERFDYRGYLVKKAKFVLLPYIILSVPAILAGLAFAQHILLGLTAGNYALWSLLVGGAVVMPMWFVPMISLFFLVSPLFHRLANSRLLPIVTIMALGISLITTRPLGNLNPFLSFVHFAGFYVLGIFLSTKFEEIKSTGKTGFMIAVGFILYVVTVFAYFASSNDAPNGFFNGFGHFNYSIFGKLTLLLAVLFLFDRFLNVKNRFLSWMAEISFGLFFMHGFFMALFAKFRQGLGVESPLVLLGAELLLVLGGAMFAVVVIKHIFKKRSRYVIGC